MPGTRRRSSRAASGRRRWRPAWASRGRRRDERLDLEQSGRRAFERARDGGAGLRLDRATEHRHGRAPDEASPVISKIPISFVEPKRFFVARRRGGRGSGRPRTAARSRRGARARAGPRRCRPSSHGRRGSSRPRTASTRARGDQPPPAPGRRGLAPSRGRPSTASGSSRSRTRRAAPPRASRATTSSSVSARISTFAAPPSRSARSFTCATDSSPVISSVRSGHAHLLQRGQEQRRLADPGLAPDSTSEAGTMPPPSTRIEARARRSRCAPPPPPRRRRAAAAPSAGPSEARRPCPRSPRQRPERGAAGAFPEPATGVGPALAARVLNGCFRHPFTL